MRAAGLIVAAGRGERLGGTVPKQYLPVGGRTILHRSLAALLALDELEAIAVVIHPDDRARYAATGRSALDRTGVALVQMVTPVTLDARMAQVCGASQGFVYAVCGAKRQDALLESPSVYTTAKT